MNTFLSLAILESRKQSCWPPLLLLCSKEQPKNDDCRAVSAIFHLNVYDLDFLHVTWKFVLIISLNLFITIPPQPQQTNKQTNPSPGI